MLLLRSSSSNSGAKVSKLLQII